MVHMPSMAADAFVGVGWALAIERDPLVGVVGAFGVRGEANRFISASMRRIERCE